MWYTVQVVCEELFRLGQDWLRKRPAVATLAGVLGVAVALRVLVAIAALLFWGQPGNPHAYRDLYGHVTYEDGTPLPATSLVLSFIPDAEPSHGPVGSRTGTILVDSQTGKFSARLSYRKDIGGASTDYRVCVLAAPQVPLDEGVVASEYSDPKKTPVRVDVARLPLSIKLPRPETSR